MAKARAPFLRRQPALSQQFLPRQVGVRLQGGERLLRPTNFYQNVLRQILAFRDVQRGSVEITGKIGLAGTRTAVALQNMSALGLRPQLRSAG